MTTLYGIKNCDTVKKARQWLDTHNIAYNYHDFRSDGLTTTMVSEWLVKSSLETLVNKRSTRWKTLSDKEKNSLDNNNAAALCAMHETLIKRPVLEHDGNIYLGFDAKNYSQLFNV